MGDMGEDIRLDDAGTVVRLLPEHRVIMDLIAEGSRVLDLGCGEGDLLLALKVRKKVRAEGIELSEACIQACVAKGLFNVQHGDLDEGLANYPDKSIDDVILTNTIQVLHRPLFLIREMARVGKRCIVSFPNFAHWPVRWQLFRHGRMPKTGKLPHEWYETSQHSPDHHHRLPRVLPQSTHPYPSGNSPSHFWPRAAQRGAVCSQPARRLGHFCFGGRPGDGR